MAQFPITRSGAGVTVVDDYVRAGKLSGLAIYTDTLVFNGHNGLDSVGSQIYVKSGSNQGAWIREFNGINKNKWTKLGSGGGSGVTIPAGIITSLPQIGDNPGSNITANDFITGEFYKSQPPTSSLTGGGVLEYRSAQTMNYTLNWSGGRQLATNPLTTIIVAGVSETFSQPVLGSSVSGTQAVSFAANTDITYSNVVTTNDSKTATSTTSFNFLPKRYFGWISTSDTAGIGTTGYDNTKITALGNELSASKAKTWNTGNPTGTQIYVYAYYYTAGTLSNLTLNGFPSISAFNVVQRNFTNALGFTGQWIIYWNKNGQTLSSDIIAN